jgi:hypothetical protein
LGFISSYLLLSRPEIIFLTRLGFFAWYPAVGLSLALLLGISPWYVFLTFFCDALAGGVFYSQPLKSNSGPTNWTTGLRGDAMIYDLVPIVPSASRHCGDADAALRHSHSCQKTSPREQRRAPFQRCSKLHTFSIRTSGIIK